MRTDDIIASLTDAGISVVARERNKPNNGDVVRTVCGGIVNLYDTGKLVVQGKNQDAIKAALDISGVAPGGASLQRIVAPDSSRKVFVVYGHDEAARTELEAMLRRWDLEPLILDQLPSGGQTIIEKLESVRKEANFAVILATPDDQGHRAGHPDEIALRARQNVVLELGMMLAILKRERVAILLKSDANMERPSDIQGLIYISYKDSLKEAGLTLAKEMDSQGIHIDIGRV